MHEKDIGANAVLLDSVFFIFIITIQLFGNKNKVFRIHIWNREKYDKLLCQLRSPFSCSYNRIHSIVQTSNFKIFNLYYISKQEDSLVL